MARNGDVHGNDEHGNGDGMNTGHDTDGRDTDTAHDTGDMDDMDDTYTTDDIATAYDTDMATAYADLVRGDTYTTRNGWTVEYRHTGGGIMCYVARHDTDPDDVDLAIGTETDNWAYDYAGGTEWRDIPHIVDGASIPADTPATDVGLVVSIVRFLQTRTPATLHREVYFGPYDTGDGEEYADNVAHMVRESLAPSSTDRDMDGHGGTDTYTDGVHVVTVDELSGMRGYDIRRHTHGTDRPYVGERLVVWSPVRPVVFATDEHCTAYLDLIGVGAVAVSITTGHAYRAV